MKKIALFSAFALIASIFVSPAFSKTFRIDVKSGKTAALSSFYLFRRSDCASGPFPKVTGSKFKNGTYRVIKQRVVARSGKCKGRRINQILIQYKSNPGFRGVDKGTIYFTYPTWNGSHSQRTASNRFILTVK